jgi:hypothetical protein
VSPTGGQHPGSTGTAHAVVIVDLYPSNEGFARPEAGGFLFIPRSSQPSYAPDGGFRRVIRDQSNPGSTECPQ